MNRYICGDLYHIEWLRAFGKWRKKLVNLHQQLTENVRSTTIYSFSHLYIGGTDSLLYPLCYRILHPDHTFRLEYTIDHYRPCGRMIGSYPQIAPLPRRYVYSMGLEEKYYQRYVKMVQSINKNRNYPYPSGIK